MILAVIPAKEESGRLPNKNMLEINGKPLIAYSIEYARKSKRIGKIIVSTDSNSIASYAKNMGVDVVFRGSDLTGETPLLDVYRHVWEQLNDKKITHIVGIQPDHPDRRINLDEALSYALINNIDDLFTVDRYGKRNGSLRILSINALNANPSVYASSIQDDCTNIHTFLDFHIAKRNLSMEGKTIKVEDYRIGEKEPVFIVAEAACNHMCDMNIAKRMIDKTAEAGADAIKFQTYKAEKLVTKEAVAFWGQEKISQMEYYKRLDRFGKAEYTELFQYAGEKGIIAFSSPFDKENADMLNELNMPIFKIASCEIPNLNFIRHVASFGRPIMLSTGASEPEEIDKAVETILEQGNNQLILMACTLSYPTKYEDVNLLRIQTLRKRYPNFVIGVSDHTEPERNMVVPSVAVALGAKVVEKHYTLDRSMTGSGHFFAVNPDNLKEMVHNIRLTEALLGDGKLGVADSEKKAWESARRSVVAEVLIKKGQIITAEMLGLKRPADGLPVSMTDLVIGKRAKQDIEPDQKITLEMLED